MHKKEHNETSVSHIQEKEATNIDTVTNGPDQSQPLQDNPPNKEKTVEQETTKTLPIWTRYWNSCRSLHIGWILSIFLFVALMTTIVCYESKFDHIKKWEQTNKHISMMNHPYYWPHRSQWWYRVDPFEEMWNNMEAMERRHQNMMNQFFLQLPQSSNIPSQTMNGHYRGYRDTNSGFIRYEINLNGTTFRGNITTSSGTTTNAVKNSLDKIWVKTQANDTQLAISGNVNLLDATIKILDNK